MIISICFVLDFVSIKIKLMTFLVISSLTLKNRTFNYYCLLTRTKNLNLLVYLLAPYLALANVFFLS